MPKLNVSRVSVSKRLTPLASLASTRLLLMAGLAFVALSLSHSPGEAGPRRDGRLYLHVDPEVIYSTDSDPSGRSGNPICEDANLSARLSTAPTVFFILASFPQDYSPSLSWVSFGIDYDTDLFRMVDHGNSANQIEISGTWPGPGSGVRWDWHVPLEGNVIELGWFAGYSLRSTSAEVELVPGPFGGFLQGADIDGYGSLGFGTSGTLVCATIGTCCFEDGNCQPLTEAWCDRERGIYFASDSCDSCSMIGACCLGAQSDWGCRITNEASCNRWSDTWAGEGSVCEPNVCIPEGSCCLTTRECRYILEDECRELQGEFIEESPCSPEACTSLGACCNQWYGTFCTLATEETCALYGGSYNGDETECEPDLCGAGLCCIDHIPTADSCLYLTLEECDEAGGLFSGGALGPQRDACWNHCWWAPVQKTNWGAIKKLFR